MESAAVSDTTVNTKMPVQRSVCQYRSQVRTSQSPQIRAKRVQKRVNSCFLAAYRRKKSRPYQYQASSLLRMAVAML